MDSFFITFIEITGSPVVQEPQSGRQLDLSRAPVLILFFLFAVVVW